MKTLTFLTLFMLLTITCSGQKLEWIKFNWIGDSVSCRFYDKLAMIIPVTVENLPQKFNMQLDLGAVNTVFYGNSFKPFVENNPGFKSKIYSSLTSDINNKIYYKFRNVDLTLDGVPFVKRDILDFRDFGEVIPKDSIFSNSEKHIGTLAPDLFQNKVLIIDYPHKRICVTENVPKQFSKAAFQKFKIKYGRIKIPFIIDGKEHYLLFDTGSSIFSLLTKKTSATGISQNSISDSLKISSWGEYYMVYGKRTNVKIQFGKKELKPTLVYYDEIKKNDFFYDQENIWGITGNAYFLDRVILIDYKNQLFGVK